MTVQDDGREPAVTPDAWARLRGLTPARIALGRAGISLPTAAHLDFQQAHAQARDAVHRPLDSEATCAALSGLGLNVLQASSLAPDRAAYLQRPDWGRRLDDTAAQALDGVGGVAPPSDLCLVVADGLSSLAIERQAVPLLAALLPRLQGWRLAPAVVVQQGRVAIGDEIGHRLGAACVLVLIGERPGLSSPDSLGLYLTWAPRPGRHDAERNCISNVRPEGLPHDEAAHRAAWLLHTARARQCSGIALKDESGVVAVAATSAANFLLPAGTAGAR